MHLYVRVFWLSLAVLTVLAWRWREAAPSWRRALGQPELAVTTIYWLAAAATWALRPIAAHNFFLLEPGVLIVDASLFVGLARISVLSRRWWVAWSAAAQLISTTAHFARLVTPHMWRLGYQVMAEASSYPALILLAIGIVEHRLERRSSKFWNGADRQRPATPHPD